MIQSNELRIGNMLHFPFTNEKVEVLGINAHVENFKIINSISFKKESNLYCEKISVLKPIPLTEEWLFKLGFEGSEIFKNSYILNSVEIYIQDGLYWYDFGNDRVEVKTIHQLQNLYFALTNEELTIKSL